MKHQYELIWDIRWDSPELFDEIEKDQSGLKEFLASLDGGCVIAPTIRPFEQGGYFRSPGHARSFNKKIDKGVVVFKGTEVATKDCFQAFRDTHALRPLGSVSRIDHFVMFEHEVFMGLTVPAAISCAETTTNFLKDFFGCHNYLPNVPRPLQVFKIPKEMADSFIDKTRPYLSDRTQFSVLKYMENLVQGGLAIYVYAYPGNTTRLAHCLGGYPGAGLGYWSAYAGTTSPEELDTFEVIRKWCKLFSDTLLAGFVPTTELHTGNCVQSQNLTIDGGMCDIDSVEPIATLTRDRDLLRALSVSVQMFVDSISVLVSMKETPLLPGMVFSAIWGEIQNNLMAEPEKLNPRLRAVIEQTGVSQLNLVTQRLQGE